MSDKLTRDEVLHVAELAKIRINENEIETYQIELKKLLNEVEKIDNVKDYDDEILISPTEEKCVMRNDSIGEMLNPTEILKNVPRHSGNYIEVPVVINE